MNLSREGEGPRPAEPHAGRASALRLARGLRDQIAEELRADILRGDYPPGRALVERELAERFRVSHAPVREALLQLAHEGLAVAQANYGVRVASIPAPEVVQLFAPIRVRLEVFALRQTMAAWTIDDVHALELCVDRISAAIDNASEGRAREADFQFHRAIVEHTGNSLLINAWRASLAATQLVALPLSSTERLRQSLQLHQQVIAACRRHDVEAAAVALEAALQAELAMPA